MIKGAGDPLGKRIEGSSKRQRIKGEVIQGRGSSGYVSTKNFFQRGQRIQELSRGRGVGDWEGRAFKDTRCQRSRVTKVQGEKYWDQWIQQKGGGGQRVSGVRNRKSSGKKGK